MIILTILKASVEVTLVALVPFILHVRYLLLQFGGVVAHLLQIRLEIPNKYVPAGKLVLGELGLFLSTSFATFQMFG